MLYSFVSAHVSGSKARSNVTQGLDPAFTSVPTAEVAELADAQASGACASQGRGGSNPPFRTSLNCYETDGFFFLKGSRRVSADSVSRG